MNANLISVSVDAGRESERRQREIFCVCRALTLLIYFAIFIFTAARLSAADDPLDRWFWRSPSPTGALIQKVIAHENGWVAVGGPGVILTSPDGVAWTQQFPDVRHGLRGVARGLGQTVAVGEHGTILRTTNHVDWREQTGGVKTTLNAIAFGDQQFIAVGDLGTILNSVDGNGWSPALAPVKTPLLAAAFGNGHFVVGGVNGVRLHSSDGQNWKSVPAPSSIAWRDVAFGAGRFVAVGSAGAIAISSDGERWSAVDAGETLPLFGVGADAGRFFAVGAGGRILTSPDGEHWNHEPGVVDETLRAIAVRGERAMAFGGSVASVVVTREGAQGWRRHDQGTTQSLRDVNHSGLGFVAVGDAGTLMTSTDGIDWTQRDTGTRWGLNAIAAGKDRLVVVGQRFVLLTSTDGTTWTRAKLTNPEVLAQFHVSGNIEYASFLDMPLRAVAFGNGRFVAVGDSGYYLTSEDGVNWAARFENTPSLSEGRMFRLRFGGGKFFGVGLSGNKTSSRTWTSVDGETWTTSGGGGLSIALGAGYGDAFGQTNFFTVGHNQGRQNRHATDWLNGLAFDKGMYVAVGINALGIPLLVGSTNPPAFSGWDGIDPPGRRPSGAISQLLAVTYGDGSFVAVGEHGTILQAVTAR